MTDALHLDDTKQLLKLYYAGQQIPSPNGGFLMPLVVRAQDDGTAIGLFECSVSSLRYEVVIPKATRTERKKVKEIVDAGDDPGCPRCGSLFRLVRTGKNLSCTRCGVPYGRA